MNWINNHKALAAALGVAGVGAIVFVLVWFQPQALFIDSVVDDTIPTAQAPSTATSTTEAPPTTEPETTDSTVPQTTTTAPPTTVAPTTAPPPVFPLTISTGEFIDLAHPGTGTAYVLELEDGSRILRFENLSVDNGPDLRVILSTSPLVDDDSSYDDGDFIDLGDLKGNQGNQNYDIPAEVAVEDYPTVAIWCRRFNVTFNAAPLDM